MNHFKLAAAVKTHIVDADKLNDDQLSDALAKDKKAFTMQEQQEIFEAIRREKAFIEPEETEEEKLKAKQSQGVAETAPELEKTIAEKNKEDVSALQEFYQYKVIPETGTIIGMDRKKMDILKGYKRTGEALKTSTITQRHADMLNAQTPNSGFYWFKKGEEEFKDASLFF